MDLRESWMICKWRTLVRVQFSAEDGENLLGYNHLVEVHYALRRWCCGLNLWRISACRRNGRPSDDEPPTADKMADVQHAREFVPAPGEYK
jgi:hypothetical protein